MTSFSEEEAVTAAVPVVAPNPTLTPTPPVIPDETQPSPTSEVAAAQIPTAIPIPTLTALPTPTPTPTETPRPTSTLTPTPISTMALPTPVPATIWLVPVSGGPGSDVALYGQGFLPLESVDGIWLGDFDVIPLPVPTTNSDGQLYSILVVPGLSAGSAPVEVHVGNEAAFAVFEVLPLPTPTPAPTPTVTPTPRPTATATPRPTRISWGRKEFGYFEAEYYITIPNDWRHSSGRYSSESPRSTIKVETVAVPFSGTPARWAEDQTIPHASFLNSGYLRDIGSPLAGSHFIQRFSSDHLCQSKDGLVIRESALVLDYRSAQPAGIAVHVDICQADLNDENRQVSRAIISSLRMH